VAGDPGKPPGQLAGPPPGGLQQIPVARRPGVQHHAGEYHKGSDGNQQPGEDPGQFHR
jgi:hypothetical protein